MKVRRALAGCLVLLAVAATPVVAQQSGSRIVGVVKDSGGGVLPGVNVEAASPALIERVKTAVTDVNGEYQIVDIRSGAYAVTFTLSGFKTAKFEAVEIGAAFTATVNATLSVGSLEETLTVTGESPVVDVRSSVSEHALNQQMLEGIPVGRGPYQVGTFMPGATTTRPDVGGSQTAQITDLSIHGTSDNTWLADGMEINGTEGNSVTATYYNAGFNQEMTVQTKALPAEALGGVTVNMIKKEGANGFKGEFYSTFTGNNLQSDNVTDQQRQLGLTAASAMDSAYDINGGVGGPIWPSRTWFYLSARRQLVDRLVANTFNVDGSQALDEQRLFMYSGRVTHQLNSSNRLSGWVEYLDKLRAHRRDTTNNYQFISPEASWVQPNIGVTANLKWTSTVRSNLLLEGGIVSMHINAPRSYQPGVGSTISANDLARSTLTGAAAVQYGYSIDARQTTAFAATWTPSLYGSHNIRVGGSYSYGTWNLFYSANQDLVAQYRNGVPDSVLVYNTPVTPWMNSIEPAIFVQDAWTIRRLTINAGLRYDQFRGVIQARTSGAGNFVGERPFSRIDDVPNWKNVVPRLAFAYDVFGNGRTAIKGNASKYVLRSSIASAVVPFNPARLISESRTWVDGNGDRVPQLSEVGPSRGGLLAGATVRADDNLSRPFDWEYTVTLEHQLARSLGVAVNYYYRRYDNLFATINTALSPSDYTAVTIANPLDGQPFTIYNQNLATVSRVDNVVMNSGLLSSNYNGIEVAVDKRMSNNFMLFGGFTVGAQKRCASASTNPNDLINTCGYDQFDSKFLSTISASYRMRYGVNVSSHVQYSTGKPLQTLYIVSRTIVPNLNQVNQTVAVLPRGDRRADNWTLVDLRLSRVFEHLRFKLEPMIELYNLTNENAALTQVETLGTSFERISSTIDGRIVRLGLKLSF